MDDENIITEESSSASALKELEDLRAQVRADQHAVSVPLLAVGTLTVATAAAPHVQRDLIATAGLLAVLIGLSLYYVRRQARVGVGTPAASWKNATLAVVAVILLLPVVLFLLSPLAVAGAVLVAIGGSTRNRTLAVYGLAFGVLAGLQQWYVISNRVGDLARLLGVSGPAWWVHHADRLVLVALGSALLIPGLVALVREQRRG